MPPQFRAVPLHAFMLLFAISAVLGVLPAYDPGLSVAALVSILTGVALYFAIALLPRSESAVRAVAMAGLLVATVVGLYFITQYAHHDYPGKVGLIARLGQLTTLLPNLGGFTPFPNAAATFLESAVPVGVALTLSAHRRAARIAWGVFTLVVLYAIALTASRGSWVALAATGGLALALTLLARLPRHTALILIGAGALVIVAGFIAAVVLGPDRLPFLSSTFSRASDRGTLFQNSLFLAGDYALTGAGLGDTFGMLYSRYSLLIQVPYLTYAHNLPLSIWLNQGLLGVIAGAGIVIAFSTFVYQVARRAAPSAIFHGAWLGVTATLLHGLTDAPEYAGGNRWAMPMLFVWLGLTVASGRLALSLAPDEFAHRVHVRRTAIAVALAVVAVGVLAIVFYRPLLAAWHTNLGAIAEARAELAPGLNRTERRAGFALAVQAYREALAYDPDSANASRRLGNLLVNLDEFDEAVPLLEAAYEWESVNPAAIKGLGLAYVWVGRTEDAARTFHRLADPAAMSNELYVWGNYRSEQGRPLLTAYAYETAAYMYPNTTGAAVWILIADAYHAADRLDAARMWYNRVLEADPQNEAALNALAEIGP